MPLGRLCVLGAREDSTEKIHVIQRPLISLLTQLVIILIPGGPVHCVRIVPRVNILLVEIDHMDALPSLNGQLNLTAKELLQKLR